MKIRSALIHIAIVAAGIFVLLGVPFMNTAYFAELMRGQTDAVTSPSVILPEPSGSYVVMINKALHKDEAKLAEWEKFFRGEEVGVIFEDISCSCVSIDSSAVEMATSLMTRLPENQMKGQTEDPTMVLSRADHGKYDVILLSKEIADMFHAETAENGDCLRFDVQVKQETQESAGE